MAKFLVTAQVKDRAQWEKSFRTHGELFRNFGVVSSPILFGTNENNEVAVLENVDNLESVMAALNSPENIEAMEADGVKRETVKVFILDKELSF